MEEIEHGCKFCIMKISYLWRRKEDEDDDNTNGDGDMAQVNWGKRK